MTSMSHGLEGVPEEEVVSDIFRWQSTLRGLRVVEVALISRKIWLGVRRPDRPGENSRDLDGTVLNDESKSQPCLSAEITVLDKPMMSTSIIRVSLPSAPLQRSIVRFPHPGSEAITSYFGPNVT